MSCEADNGNSLGALGQRAWMAILIPSLTGRTGYSVCVVFLFCCVLRLYLFERESMNRVGEGQREKEADSSSLSVKPKVGLNPRTQRT